MASRTTDRDTPNWSQSVRSTSRAPPGNRPEMIAYSEDGDTVMVEAPDLADIRAAVAELPDADNLERYFRQNPEWASRADVIEIFSKRKAELEK